PEPLVATIVRQAGVVSVVQALALGMTMKAIRCHEHAGRWQRVHPGVYVVYSGPLPPHALVWAGLLHAGAGAVLDGPTALAVHGLHGFEDGRVHVRIANERHPERRPGLVIRRTRHLEPGGVVER